MDLMSLISQLADTGLVDIATIVIMVLAVRHSSNELRRGISADLDESFDALKTDLQLLLRKNRDEIRAIGTDLVQIPSVSRDEIRACQTYAFQSHKETIQHLMDVRERLANIEGRLGAPTPRMAAVSPPLEVPAEAPPS